MLANFTWAEQQESCIAAALVLYGHADGRVDFKSTCSSPCLRHSNADASKKTAQPTEHALDQQLLALRAFQESS